MKKTALLFVALFLFTLTAITPLHGKDEVQSFNPATGEIIIIRYSPVGANAKYITIYRGGSKAEDIELTKEEMNKTVSNYIIDLLNKFNVEGYELVSTLSYGASDQIYCYLKKVK